MSLYRFFTKADMPSRVPSLSDKEIENANISVKKSRKGGHQSKSEMTDMLQRLHTRRKGIDRKVRSRIASAVRHFSRVRA